MKNYSLLRAILCSVFVGVSMAADVGPAADQGAMPSRPNKGTTTYEEAFAEAQSDVQTRMDHAREKARAEAKRRAGSSWEALGAPGIGPYPPWGKDWWALAAENRSVAVRLAKDEGEGIVPYLRDHVDESPLLALLTLDELDKHNEAAQAFLGLIPKWQHTALLWVSFCSAKTREAAANQLAANMSTDQPAFRTIWRLASLADFVAVTGNADTIGLLDRVAKTPEGKPWKVVYERAINRLRFRLSLPKKEQEQRAQDELLFWQTTVGAPVPRDVTSGLVFAAKCLAVQKLTISSAYLIEQLEQVKSVTDKGTMPNQPEKNDDIQMDQSRFRLALLILANQKDNDAVPAMVNLARRIPSFRNDVEITLKQFDTPEAKKALRELPIVGH